AVVDGIEGGAVSGDARERGTVVVETGGCLRSPVERRTAGRRGRRDDDGVYAVAGDAVAVVPAVPVVDVIARALGSRRVWSPDELTVAVLHRQRDAFRVGQVDAVRELVVAAVVVRAERVRHDRRDLRVQDLDRERGTGSRPVADRSADV